MGCAALAAWCGEVCSGVGAALWWSSASPSVPCKHIQDTARHRVDIVALPCNHGVNKARHNTRSTWYPQGPLGPCLFIGRRKTRKITSQAGDGWGLVCNWVFVHDWIASPLNGARQANAALYKCLVCPQASSLSRQARPCSIVFAQGCS